MKSPLFSTVRFAALFLAVSSSLTTLSAALVGPTISGYVYDSTNSPIASVTVYATGPNNKMVTNNTDGSGHYSLTVSTNSTWSVGVSSDSLNNLPGCYNTVVDNITVKIATNNGSASFIVPDCGGGSELDGYLVDGNNNPIAGVGLSASTADGYSTKYTTTDANGFYEFVLEDAVWDVELNCTNLNSLGFQCVTGQTNEQIGGNYTYEQNFVAQQIGQAAFGAFFSAQVPLGNNVYYMSWDANHLFGYYSMLEYPYIYRYDMGWEYYIDAGNAAHGAYFYDFQNGAFYYTEPDVFPYIYDFNVNAWLWYEPDSNNAGYYTSNPRWFLNLSTQVWTNSL